MSKLRRLAWAMSVSGAVLMLAAGCGDSEEKTLSPTEQCNEVASTECNQIYACTTEEERRAKGLTVNNLECILGLALELGCASATAEKICAGDQPYSAAQAKACVKEANAASCATIKANFPQVNGFAPSCSQCVPSLPGI